MEERSLPMFLNCFTLSLLTRWLSIPCTEIQLLPNSWAEVDGLVSSPLSLNLNPQLTCVVPSFPQWPALAPTGQHRSFPIPQNRSHGTHSGAFLSLSLHTFSNLYDFSWQKKKINLQTEFFSCENHRKIEILNIVAQKQRCHFVHYIFQDCFHNFN